MIAPKLTSYIASLPRQSWLSPALTATLQRFLRTGERRPAEPMEGLMLMHNLTNALGRAKAITAPAAAFEPLPLYGVVTVFDPRHTQRVCHTATIIDLIPEPLVAFGSLTSPGVHVVNLDKHLMEEARRGLPTHLFAPEQVSDLISAKPL